MGRCLLLVLALTLHLPLFAATDDQSPSPLDGLSFRNIGPQVDGRISGVTGVPGDPLTFYLAAAQGGVWKSSNGGHKWTPIFDDQPSGAIGSIAVAPSDHNVVYVGGGEANIRGNVQAGEGIFKSTDAGATWTHQLKLRGQIGQIVVHPDDADIAFAAVLGNPFKAAEDRGVYRTVDGGASWDKVLYVDADTGASDVSINESNPRIVYAGTWQTRRQPWGHTSGGPGGGLWRSSDGGETWKRIVGEASGLPAGDWGKVGVAVSPADGKRVFALIEADEGGLFRSDNGGQSFKLINDHQVLRQRAWYYTTLNPHPTDADTLWMPQVRMLRSIDGGKSVQSIPGFSHGDHHDIWIDPTDPQRMIGGHDGGVDLSMDGGATWFHPRLPLAQFYNIDVDRRVPYHVGGTMQDYGTASGPSMSLLGGTAPLSEWRVAGGGEAGDFKYDRELTGVAYAGEYSGYLSRADEATGQTRAISAWPANAIGWAAKDLQYRFQWTAPIATSAHDPAVIYHAAQVLFRSPDRGVTWEAISGDLTRNDVSKQQWSGGPFTGDNTGVEVYNTIFSVAESPLDASTVWAGTDDGLLHLTRDGGQSWNEVTPKGLPEWSTIEGIEASLVEAGRVYVVAHRYRMGDDRPLLYRSDDFGKRWTVINKGIPADMPLYALREDPADPNTLYLGAERDLYISIDRGDSWRSMRLNLPRVAVTDLELSHTGDLVVGTRGRSIWVLADVASVRQSLVAAGDGGALVQAPAQVVRWRNTRVWGGDGLPNASRSAVIRYRLTEPVEGPFTLDIVDANGDLVRTLKSEAEPARYAPDDPDAPTPEPKPDLSNKAGWNAVNWDFRHNGARKIPGAKTAFGRPYVGPIAIPGAYQARLNLPSGAVSATFELVADPRSTASAADLRDMYAFGLTTRDALDLVAVEVIKLRAWHDQAAELAERLEGREYAAAVVSAAQTVVEQAQAIEGRLHNRDAVVAYDFLAQRGGTRLHGQFASLLGHSQSSDHPPTAGMIQRFLELRNELQILRADVDGLEQGALAELEAASASSGLGRVITP